MLKVSGWATDRVQILIGKVHTGARLLGHGVLTVEGRRKGHKRI